MIFEPEDFLVNRKRIVVPRDVLHRSHSGFFGMPNGVYLQDTQASFFYSATLGGFFPVDLAVISLLAASVHYGIGAFEGIHSVVGPKGTGYNAPSDNAIRLMYSVEGINPRFLSQLISASLAGESLSACPWTPEQVYAAGRKGTNLLWSAKGAAPGAGIASNIPFPTNLQVAFSAFDMAAADGTAGFGGGPRTRLFDTETIVSIFNALAFYNRLVSYDYFPTDPEKVEGGYGRPLVYYGNAFEWDRMRHLKIPSVGRTPEFAVLNLPWGNYLNAQDYIAGLTVLVSPFERVGTDMPNGKVTGNYVNSKMSIDTMRLIADAAKGILAQGGALPAGHKEKLELLASLGEVLVKTRDGTFVEGSAENLFIIVKTGTGFEAWTPPVSDRPLPGTNRSRAIGTFESVNILVRYQSVNPDELKRMIADDRVAGMLFTGTGADIIHVKQIVNLPGLKSLVKMAEFGSEDEPGRVLDIPSLLDFMTVTPINGGQRHPIIGELLEKHRKRMVEKLFVPAYAINVEKLAYAMGLELDDFAETRRDKQLCGCGFFSDSFLSVDETQKRYRAMMQMLTKGLNAQWKKNNIGVPRAVEIKERIRKSLVGKD